MIFEFQPQCLVAAASMDGSPLSPVWPLAEDCVARRLSFNSGCV
jgi:hypothetical protein